MTGDRYSSGFLGHPKSETTWLAVSTFTKAPCWHCARAAPQKPWASQRAPQNMTSFWDVKTWRITQQQFNHFRCPYGPDFCRWNGTQLFDDGCVFSKTSPFWGPKSKAAQQFRPSFSVSGRCGAERISVTWELPIWTGADPRRQLLAFFTCSWSRVIKILMPCKSTLVGPGTWAKVAVEGGTSGQTFLIWHSISLSQSISLSLPELHIHSNPTCVSLLEAMYIYTYIHTYMHTCIHAYIHTYITLHYIHYTTLHYITLRYITYITLHYTTLHHITLHYITLHCITLHYITYIHTYMFSRSALQLRLSHTSAAAHPEVVDYFNFRARTSMSEKGRENGSVWKCCQLAPYTRNRMEWARRDPSIEGDEKTIHDNHDDFVGGVK